MSSGRTADGRVRRPPNAGDPRGPRVRGRALQVQSDGRKCQQGITLEKYERLCDAFWEKQTVSYVATTCAVNRATARKYCERGDPARGLPAIRPRWLASLRKAQKAVDRDRTVALKESIVQLQNLKTSIDLALRPLFMKRGADGQWRPPGPGEDVDDPKALRAFLANWLKDPHDLVDSVGKIMHHESFALGEPDAGIDDVTAQAQRLDELIRSEVREWTYEEKKALLERGERPCFMKPKVI